MAIRYGTNRFPDHIVGTPEDDQLYGYSRTEGRWTDTGGDTLEGGGGNDYLAGGWGRDTLRGGPDNDTLDGGLGGDVLDGGTGVDTVAYWFSTAAVSLNLLEGAGYEGEAADDTFISIENVIGSSHNDTIVGDHGSNRIEGWIGHDTILGLDGDDDLWGGDGADLLYGGEGRDYLYGDAGADRLRGGAGADSLTGGEGADRYIYSSVSDSPASLERGTADEIHFGEGDMIDLSAIDANTTGWAAGNQAFTWIDAPFFSGAGQLRMEIVGKSWQVLGETTGDGVADFMIWVTIGHFDSGDIIL